MNELDGLNKRIAALEQTGLRTIGSSVVCQSLSYNNDWKWNIAAGLSVILTGLAVTYLTGGEEEFPDVIANEHIESQESNSQDDLECLNSEDYSHREALESKLSQLSQSQNGNWAQLFAKMTDLQEQVHSLREIMKTSVNQRESACKDNCEKIIEPVISTEDRILSIRQQVKDFIAANNKHDASNNELLFTATQTLSMYIKNLLDHQQNPRYRKIATSNATFQQAVGKMARVTELLAAVGFQQKGQTYEWTWHQIQPPVASSSTSSSFLPTASSISSSQPPLDINITSETATTLLTTCLACLERAQVAAVLTQMESARESERESQSQSSAQGQEDVAGVTLSQAQSPPPPASDCVAATDSSVCEPAQQQQQTASVTSCVMSAALDKAGASSSNIQDNVAFTFDNILELVNKNVASSSLSLACAVTGESS